MPRIARESFETSFFHVIIQGVNREYIFNKKEYKEKYLNLINKYREEYNISILAYCIMNNHAHILICIKQIGNMIQFMHKLNTLYAHYYNKNENRVGIVFRNRYVSEAIYDEKYLVQCIKYIHMNPVKAGMVKTCEEYKYSSINEYIKNSNSIKNPILMEIFGSDYLNWINNIEVEGFFNDIDNSREEIVEQGIKRFEKINKVKLEEIIEDKKTKKELIKFLKQECKITYVEMMKKLNITKGEMETLKKYDFETRPRNH